MESLGRDADDLAEQAEAKTGSNMAQLLSKSNALRRAAKDKLAQIKALEDQTATKSAALRNFCQLQVDINSVNTNLELSDDNMKVTYVMENQPYPDHPDRFDVWPQLLCRNDLTGRCYWEVEWSERVDISVSYRRIRRKGNNLYSWFGRNNQSWSLICSDRGYSVCHDTRETSIFSSSSSSSSSVPLRVAVYVDCPAGSLSFYRVSSDSLIHLHTFNTTFTEPLCAGFGFTSPGSSVSVVPL